MIFLYVLLFKKKFFINSDFEIFFSHHLSDELKSFKKILEILLIYNNNNIL